MSGRPQRSDPQAGEQHTGRPLAMTWRAVPDGLAHGAPIRQVTKIGISTKEARIQSLILVLECSSELFAYLFLAVIHGGPRENGLDSFRVDVSRQPENYTLKRKHIKKEGFFNRLSTKPNFSFSKNATLIQSARCVRTSASIPHRANTFELETKPAVSSTASTGNNCRVRCGALRN